MCVIVPIIRQLNLSVINADLFQRILRSYEVARATCSLAEAIENPFSPCHRRSFLLGGQDERFQEIGE